MPRRDWGTSLCWSDGGSEAWTRITTLAVRSVLNSHVGLSLAFRRPWSHSTRLFSYWPVLCNAAGIKPSMALAKAGARSVITSAGSP